MSGIGLSLGGATGRRPQAYPRFEDLTQPARRSSWASGPLRADQFRTDAPRARSLGGWTIDCSHFRGPQLGSERRNMRRQLRIAVGVMVLGAGALAVVTSGSQPRAVAAT